MSSPAHQLASTAIPPVPRPGQVYVDGSGAFWKITKLTVSQTETGFYLVHLCHGVSLDSLEESMVIGPRAFAALARAGNLRPFLHSV